MVEVESLAFAKILGSMKRLEKSRFSVNCQYWLDEEDFGDDNLHVFLKDSSWDKNRDLYIEAELLKLVKVEDWYNDKTAIMKVLRKGKGRSPYADSDIQLRMKIEVNDNEIYSNYPKDLNQPIEEHEDYKLMTPEERVEHLKDESLLHLRLDSYVMPSLL